MIPYRSKRPILREFVKQGYEKIISRQFTLGFCCLLRRMRYGGSHHHAATNNNYNDHGQAHDRHPIGTASNVNHRHGAGTSTFVQQDNCYCTRAIKRRTQQSNWLKSSSGPLACSAQVGDLASNPKSHFRAPKACANRVHRLRRPRPRYLLNQGA
jgi:hypothetical protein